MFQLRKLHPPFGTRDAPVYEGSYSEGIIPVVEGLCSVKNQDSRDYLLKIGYVDTDGKEPAKVEASAAVESVSAKARAVPSQPAPKPEPKRGLRKLISKLKKRR